MQKLLIYTDGGARGNPGPGAIGLVIFSQNNQNQKIFSCAKKIGNCTNNIAEYTAVLEAHKWLLANKHKFITVSEINFFLDSKLVVNQLKGLFKIKNQELVNLYYSIKEMEKKFNQKIIYQLIPREENITADYLVNQALDS